MQICISLLVMTSTPTSNVARKRKKGRNDTDHQNQAKGKEERGKDAVRGGGERRGGIIWIIKIKRNGRRRKERMLIGEWEEKQGAEVYGSSNSSGGEGEREG